MTYDFDALLDRVEKPARYTGGEMNAEVKPISQAEISFAFCFPDTYEVAMSHLGHENPLRNSQRTALCRVRAGMHAVGRHAL